MNNIRKITAPAAILFVFAAFFVFSAATASADSLWNDGSNLFADRKAQAIGDIVTVKVAEKLSDTDEGKTSSTKDTTENIAGGTGFLAKIIKAFGLGTASSMSGNTKIERTKNVNMTVSCLVVDVMPNGNLVIQGERSMVSGAERVNVRYSGVVRPQDIGHNNQVDSTKVANAEIVYNGKGVITRTQRPGIINQILQAIF